MPFRAPPFFSGQPRGNNPAARRNDLPRNRRFRMRKKQRAQGPGGGQRINPRRRAGLPHPVLIRALKAARNAAHHSAPCSMPPGPPFLRRVPGLRVLGAGAARCSASQRSRFRADRRRNISSRVVSAMVWRVRSFSGR